MLKELSQEDIDLMKSKGVAMVDLEDGKHVLTSWLKPGDKIAGEKIIVNHRHSVHQDVPIIKIIMNTEESQC